MADPIWRTIFSSSSDLLETGYEGVFGVADYEFGISFLKFKKSGEILRVRNKRM